MDWSRLEGRTDGEIKEGRMKGRLLEKKRDEESRKRGMTSKNTLISSQKERHHSILTNTCPSFIFISGEMIENKQCQERWMSNEQWSFPLFCCHPLFFHPPHLSFSLSSHLFSCMFEHFPSYIHELVKWGASMENQAV